MVATIISQIYNSILSNANLKHCLSRYYRTLEEIGRNQKQYKTALGAGDRKFESFYPDQLKASQSIDCEAFFIVQY